MTGTYYDRLVVWRDTPSIVPDAGTYTAGGRAFATDLICLLAAVEGLRERLAEVAVIVRPYMPPIEEPEHDGSPQASR